MYNYSIYTNTITGERFISRDDGTGIPSDRGNRDARFFAFEWFSGASVIDAATSLPIAYSDPELALFNLDPVTVWPPAS